ncbi:hypothetical protein RUM43_014126 [Polyplax serrata]|uniref:Uncharacterized protein n=1 Tax=Polyplax serrata TaxID=468196 RepID=A0AAN8RSB4_POLSC
MTRIILLHVLCMLLVANDSNTRRNLVVGHLQSIPFNISTLRNDSLKRLTDLWRNMNLANDNHLNTSDLLTAFEKINVNIKRMEKFKKPVNFYFALSNLSYATTEKEIMNIDTNYETFVRFQQENSKGAKKTPLAWLDLAETFLQKSDLGVRESLERIHQVTTTALRADNLFTKIEKDLSNYVCDLENSPHQAIYNLYNDVALTQLKGVIILQFSYMILKLFHKGDFTAEAVRIHAQYVENTKKQEESVRQILTSASRGMYKCDPKQHVEGVTYEKLTKLMQGYIENEVNLNAYGTCGENCAYYVYTEYNGCFKNQFCAHQPKCQGKVLNCRYVDSDMTICRSSNSERRYDWVEYENGNILGSKGVCEQKNLFQVDSWWRYLFWHCSYCLCLCDESVNSDRYFSLRDVTADIHENKVLTGVRLVKKNRIIHIQIQQGVLEPHGVINRDTLSWKPVDNYTVEDEHVENNVDYHTMSWLERTIDVDDIEGQPGQTITGVRFRKLGSHLNVEARITPIDFAAGKVYKEEQSYWKGNDNTDGSLKNPRTEIKLSNSGIPIRNGPNLLRSRHDQFVQFQSTSFEKDIAQTTVPFIDSQSITSQGFILSGIGLIYRGKLGSGGFIAPKLITYDFLQHKP